MTSEKNYLPTLKSDMKLSTEEYEAIEDYAALNYSPKQMAIMLAVEKKRFLESMANEESKIFYHFTRGKLLTTAAIGQKILEHAKSGNVTSIQTFNSMQETQNFDELKRKILFGYEED